MKARHQETASKSRHRSSPRLSSHKHIKQTETDRNHPLDVTFGEIKPRMDQKSGQTPRRSQAGKANSPIFKDLLFFIEVFENQENQIEKITDQITNLGGKILRQLSKNVHYYIYQNGRPQTLNRAFSLPDYSTVKVVTPAWLQSCLQANKLILDLSPYQVEQHVDTHMEDSIVQSTKDSRSRSKSQKMCAIGEKKRKMPPSEASEEGMMESKTTSKRKIKAKNKLKVVDMSAKEAIEEDSNSDFDEEEINRIVKQVQDQRFFKKEFEKDLKKFAKLQAELDADEDDLQNNISHLPKPKRDIKHMTKGQLIDSYIDGQVELPDFIEHMTLRMKQRKGAKHSRKALKGNKRMTEMFKPSTKRTCNDITVVMDEDENKMNKTAFVTLQDFLFDIDKQATPIKHLDDKHSGNILAKQTMLNFDEKPNIKSSQVNILNFKPINLLKESQSMLHRLAKSSTFTHPKPTNDLTNQFETSKNQKPHLSKYRVLAFNANLRRAHSYNPSKQHHSNISPNKENKMPNTQYAENPSASKVNHNRKKKQWEKILPVRQVPTRIAKLNVSYMEDADGDSTSRYRRK